MAKFIKHSETLFLIFITALTLFLHLYILPSQHHFYGDEAIMSYQIRAIVTEHRFATVGLLSSIGHNIYQSPYFYYFYIIPGVISNFNPLSYAVSVALLSSSSVIILYFVLKNIYNHRLAQTSTFIYAISYNMNLYGRFEWTQNLIPFFIILSFFALYKYLKGKDNYLILFIFSISSITQLHIIGYFMIPILLFFLPMFIKRTKSIRIWTFSVLVFIIPYLPTLYHEIKYNFEMTRSLIFFILNPTHHLSIIGHFQELYSYLIYILNTTLLINNDFILMIILLTGISYLGVRTYKNTDKVQKTFNIYLLLIFGFTNFMALFYSGPMYIQYGEQLFVIYSIFAGITIYMLFLNKETIIAALILLVSIIMSNFREFNNEIIQGYHSAYYEDKICQLVASIKSKEVKVIYNSMQNPDYINYICENQYNKKLSSDSNAIIIYVQSDMRSEFKYWINN